MSLKLFIKEIEKISVEEACFLKHVRDISKFRETRANLQLMSLRRYIYNYEQEFQEYHEETPFHFEDEEEECPYEIVCLVDISKKKENTMKKDMKKKYRKAGSLRRKKIREKYSYKNPLNRIHGYLIIQKSPGNSEENVLAINVICASNYSDVKGIGGYIMKLALRSAKTAGFEKVVLEVGNQGADEREESDEEEESDDEESDEEEEDEDYKQIEKIADIISSKLWRISVRHINGIPVYNIGQDYILSIVTDYLMGENTDYEEWESNLDDDEYGYGGYYYIKGKVCCKQLMDYYKSYGFVEDPKVNTEWKCFSIVPFPSMIKQL